MNSLEDRYAQTLRQHSVRSTNARRAVFDALCSVEKPMKLHDIITATKNTDRASVYRTLELFEKLQIVNVILVGWKKHFELAAPYKSHHHHIHCEKCGQVVSIESPSLEKLIKTISEQKGFHLHRHTLELSGCCVACQKSDEKNLDSGL